jgi:hypothetical protein
VKNFKGIPEISQEANKITILARHLNGEEFEDLHLNELRSCSRFTLKSCWKNSFSG